MLHFIDLEFIERGPSHPIDLISLGIVAEDGREYSALNVDCNWDNASEWVKSNVLAGLPEKPSDFSYCKQDRLDHNWLRHSAIGDDVLRWIGNDPNPIFWGNFCATDWVVFYQLWGRLEDKPEHFPWRCRDVVQYCEDQLGLSTDNWPKSLETPGNHSALLGAKTVKTRWEWCRDKEIEMRAVPVRDGGVFRKNPPWM